jgi:hypothetical protein
LPSGRLQAAAEAVRLRLRPILMTSFAFILGVLLLVIAKGAGAEMDQALGTAVFFGMLGVTFFGLIFTPIFLLIDLQDVWPQTEARTREVPRREGNGRRAGGEPATEVIKDEPWLKETFISIVQQRGAAIKARGASSAASAANAAIDTVWSLVHPTRASDWHSIAVCSDGSYEVGKRSYEFIPYSHFG